MKTASLLSLLTLCCCFFMEAIAQEYTPAPNPSECWASEMVIQEGDLPTETAVIRGGREITTQGTLRVLVIFVRFADDTYNHPLYWPDYNVLPGWAQNIVNAQVPENSIYTPGNMSDFFDRASGGDGIGNLGSFRLIGDVYYVTTDSPRAFYGNSIQTVNEHVLTKLDPIVDYALYDNWRFMADSQVYNHEYLPGVGDGKVDYIFMNWRHVSPHDTAANLGIKNLYANVVKDGKQITSSSGSTQFRYARPNRNIGGPYDQVPGSILVPGHEFTHYIFGGTNTTGHIDGRTVYQGIPNIGNVQFFAFMTSNSTAPFSAYERYRAGWLNPEIIEADMSSVLLMDTHVKNKAVMIPVRYDNNTPPNIVEYFLIENFHTRNDYSTANPFLRRQIFDHTLRRGLLVFHIENEDLSLPANSNLDIECADGLWQWNLSIGQTTPCDRCDDRIFPDIPSPNLTLGVFDERDIIYLQVGTCLNQYSATSTVGSCLGWYRKDAILGDNEDFFRDGETDVFSRWSNPSTIRADLQITDKAFEIDSYNASNKEFLLKVMVTYNGAIGLKPSKPQDLRLVAANVCSTSIRWLRNQEPDTAGYNLYRGVVYAGSGEPTYTKINSTLITDSFYVDANYGSLSGLPRNKDLYHRYRLTCVDTQGKESVKSEYVEAFFTHIIDAQVDSNWNMTSIPVAVCDFGKTAVYPTAISPAYKYTSSGYVQTDPLNNNFGWWIKFGPQQTITYAGSRIDSMAMPVTSDWNIIGSISVPVETCAVTSIPSGIRASQFFKYQNGYLLTDKLYPGFGYWVKASENGHLILKNGTACPPPISMPPKDKFIITDSEGNQQELFVVNGEVSEGAESIEMPPAFPEANFDVRWGSGDYQIVVEPTGEPIELPIDLNEVSYPITLEWELDPENGLEYAFIPSGGLGKAPSQITGTGRLTVPLRANKIRLVANGAASSGVPVLPTAYALGRNYPNPFNPSTTFKFDLPEPATVSLVVYDLLGRQIAEIVSGRIEAGYHSRTWNATGLASSGVYFARFTATGESGEMKYSSIGKLILMK